MAELSGKVAMVTGAASGIGEASARALAAAGAKVAVADLKVESAQVVADSIKQTGADAIAVGFDVSDEAQVTAGVDAVVKAFGGVDILHNNAAITSVEFLMRDGMVGDLDVALWDQTMAVNVRGYMLCAKHVIPLMLARGGGVIINTSSGAGMQGEMVRSAYGTSKAAVIGFTRSVATQYGKQGIRCVTVMPGLTMTRSVAASMPPPIIDMMKRHTLTRELASPENVADAVAFLASDRAALITGAVIPVDGGFLAHGPSYADEVAMWAAASGGAAAAVAGRFRAALEARGKPKMGPDEVALLGQVLTGDAVWHGAGHVAPEDPRGTEALANHWNELATADGGGAKVEIGDVYADATHVVGVVVFTAGAGAAARTVRQANVFHLNGDGLATEAWSVPADVSVAAALAGNPLPDHPNVAVFRAAEEARARNTFGPEDTADIEKFLREDVHWISPWGKGPSTRAEVFGQFAGFNQATGGTMQLTLNDIFADATHAVSLVRLQADRPDRPSKHMDVKEANVFHFDPDGHAYEFWGVADDQGAINNFWT